MGDVNSTTTPTWRSATALRICAIAALAGGVAIGSFDMVRESQTPEETPDASPTTSTVKEVAPFTTADAGSCVTWSFTAAGEVADFEQTDCASPHRFEVTAREDLAAYPSSEFGPDAPAPDLIRQAQLREELCQQPTISYLNGTYDPRGRYSIAPVLPPPSAWEAGDRTMLCGLQSTDPNGVPLETTGKVADQDQARVYEPGTCVSIDAANVPHTVNCDTDHVLEVTRVVNLTEFFPDSVPTEDQQNEELNRVCTQAAEDFLGNEENLYQSTLQPFWTTLSSDAWQGGSKSVNCSLIKAREDGGFSTLKGTATGPFTIDGAAPPPQPERNPLREDLPR
ncbi:septum formation family protein [Corynebacterium sp. 11A]|uniref:septum formation family protein n=1 Tax=Corynebacterium sp. 11A TaxID=2080510 RepID=UPI00124BCEEA|nr:septum formation family protein [Corynebacterium sp. 11A]